MHYLLAAVLFLGILTLWAPGYWAVAVFECGILGLGMIAAFRWRHAARRFSYPLAPLAFAVAWGLFQWAAGRTASVFETRIAVARWATLLAVFMVGLTIFQDPRVHQWFRSAMLWFAFAVAVLATLQNFTAGGKVFWIFPTEYTTARVMGPILYHNHYAAFMEVVLPLAIYRSLLGRRDALVYATMAAAFYASLLASASRSGVILGAAEFVAVVALLWLRGRTSGRDAGKSLLRVALLLAAFTAVVGWGTVWRRLQERDPFAYRREFAISSVRMIEDRPWFGSGMGTWPIVYPAYAIIDGGAYANRAHDDWLEWTADGGLPFGIAMATLFLWCVPRAVRSVWGVGVLSVFLHATVDYPFSRPALAAWIVVTIALLAFAPVPRLTTEC